MDREAKVQWLEELMRATPGSPSFGELENEQWLDWYLLTPSQRWTQSQQLWDFYLATGGSLDPQPDSQSPFDAVMQECAISADGRPSVHLVRRSTV